MDGQQSAELIKPVATVKDSLPEVQLTNKLENSFMLKTFEIVYNCNATLDGTALLELTVTSSDCPVFSIYWKKDCKKGGGSKPKLNVGLQTNPTALIKEGVETSILSTYSIPANTPTLVLVIAKPQDTSNTNIYDELILDKPKLNYDENLLDILISEELKGGGYISTIPRKLGFAFACKPNQKGITSIQVSLNFNSKESISFSFGKECDTITAIEEYFSFIYFLYWLLLVLLFSFITIFVVCYMKKENISFNEFVGRVSSSTKEKIEQYKSQIQNKYRSYKYGEITSNKPTELLSDMNDSESVESDIHYNLNLNQEKQIQESKTNYGGI